MKLGNRTNVVVMIAVSFVGVLIFAQRVAAADDLEVLRGPVHEAFAESVSYEPQPGILVGAAVPELIEELPPEQRPEGGNVAWIPGYWVWDDEQGAQAGCTFEAGEGIQGQGGRTTQARVEA